MVLNGVHTVRKRSLQHVASAGFLAFAKYIFFASLATNKKQCYLDSHPEARERQRQRNRHVPTTTNITALTLWSPERTT